MLVHASALRAVLVQSSPVKKLRVSILVFTRAASSTSSAASGQLQHSPHVRDIRNIGIIAHVDAVSLWKLCYFCLIFISCFVLIPLSFPQTAAISDHDTGQDYHHRAHALL